MKQLVPRRSDRIPYLCAVEVRSSNGAVEFRADVIDLGTWGLAMFAKRFLRVGESVTIKFSKPRAPGVEPIQVVGNVAHARIDIDGNIMGISFASPLGEAEIRKLSASRGLVSIL
jgi:hypothetical protein